jgi:hypothetical protein
VPGSPATTALNQQKSPLMSLFIAEADFHIPITHTTMSDREQVDRDVKSMRDYLNDVARSTDGPGASRRGEYNFEKRASAHRYMKGEAQRIMRSYSSSAWAHQADYLQHWANDSGYNG